MLDVLRLSFSKNKFYIDSLQIFFSNKNVHKYIHPSIIQFYNYLLGQTVATFLSENEKKKKK